MFSLFAKTANAAYNFQEKSGLKSTAGKLGYNTSNAAPNIDQSISNGIAFVLSFLGVIFLVLAIYAGFLWMSSQGNDTQIKKARDILINSIIGLIIVSLAYAITIFIFSGALKGFLK